MQAMHFNQDSNTAAILLILRAVHIGRILQLDSI